MTFTSPVLALERDGAVATLWLDRPEKRNAMGPELWSDLPRAIAAVEADTEVRALVLAARGPHFSVGLDLTSMGGTIGGGDVDGEGDRGHPGAARRLRLYREIKRLQASTTAVAECRVPVVAAVHGACIGGGIDLVTACDIRLAAADAVFSVRETRMAIVADVGTLQRLPSIVAAGHVAELVYTGKDIDAERARAIGLVNDVHPDQAAVVEAATALAREIAANSPLAVQGTKAVLRSGRGPATEAGLDHVALWNAAFLQSRDLGEALAAFLERREATFTGE